MDKTYLLPKSRWNSLKYAVVQDQVLYSPFLANGSSLKTVLGKNLTITVFNGETYVNDAKIIWKDILVANGVVHAIDKVSTFLCCNTHSSLTAAIRQALNFSNPNARPSFVSSTTSSPTSSSSNSPASQQSHGLSTGAKAGIAIGSVIAGLAIIGAAFFLLKRHRNSTKTDPAKDISEKRPGELGTTGRDPQELSTTHWPQELDGPGTQELEGERGVHELDGQGPRRPPNLSER